ncbi:glycogen/starch synthase, ADP-glucose type [Paenibacillus curdlanolyticus YK9]|uniref:Glycogen synthase n=2 Tax=Paenibacillus curdlanolyticus TaxID=59840 RepID=E0I4Z0_9BACL|nr:glycogen/starch synthase, ADP-glucose type [Paenibacillus curdlanolyticus YK9]
MSKAILFAAGYVDPNGIETCNTQFMSKMQDKGLTVGAIVPLHRLNGDASEGANGRILAVIEVAMPYRTVQTVIRRTERSGIPFYWIDAPTYFDRPNRFGELDDAERYLFWCKAVVQALPALDMMPDLIHCQDWPSAFIPFLLAHRYRSITAYKAIRTMYTFHSIGNQGIFDQENCWNAGLFIEELQEFGLDYYEQLNFMQAGLRYADAITTVSPQYAREIATEMCGMTMEQLIADKQEQLYGIVNGIDHETFDPATDQQIAANYKVDHLAGKSMNKAALQLELGLPQRADVPVLLFHSAFSSEKGADMLRYGLPDLLKSDLQLIVLHAGPDSCGFEEAPFARFFAEAAQSNESKFRFHPYDAKRKRRLFAGADMLLMPSASEPCGFEQQLAMRYGTVPIVRSVGGLADTVIPYSENPADATGFAFHYANEKVMLHAVRQAIGLYNSKEQWEKLIRNGMKRHYSIDDTVDAYWNVYRKLIGDSIGMAASSHGNEGYQR